MIYLIDGYNFIFQKFTIHNDKPFQDTRNQLFEYFENLTSFAKIKILIILDANKTDEENINYEYFENFDVIYTPRNQSADEYIIEYISHRKKTKDIFVVTSDNLLTLEIKSYNAKVISIEKFLEKFKHKLKATHKLEKQQYETDENIEKYLKIFENKSNN